MNKSKPDTEADSFAGAFSGVGGYPHEFGPMISVNAPGISAVEGKIGGRRDQSPYAGLLRQIVLFLPGTFLLFFTSFGVAIIFMELVFFGRGLQDFPDDYPLQFAIIGAIILVSGLMTWAGLGDIKNKKHIAIPASLILSGAIFGAAIKAAASISELADKMLDDFNYLIYLFPLALVIPILAKNIVELKAQDTSATEQ